MSTQPMFLDLLKDGQLSLSTVLFATDFSSASHTAGLYAAAIAAHFQAELLIVHSFIPSQSAREAEMKTQHESTERRDHAARLETTAAALTLHGQSPRTSLLEGDPSDTIASFADATPGSLLVLGTHGGGAVERRLLGSMAERTLRRTACPTITVGPLVPAPHHEQPFCSMLYATDCSPMASRAAPLACAIAAAFASTLKVISIIDEHDGPVPDTLADLDFRTHQELAEKLDGQCDHFSESRTLATARSAREAILQYAHTANTDLLILGVHRRATIELLDRNSITIQIITEARCPVLTVTRGALSPHASPPGTALDGPAQ